MARFLRHTIEKISDRIHSFSAGRSMRVDGGVNEEKSADGSVVEPPDEKSLSNGETRLRDTDWLPAERRRRKFVDLYLFAVDASLRGGADQWWQRAFGCDRLPDPEQGVKPLKDFCLHHLLYEAGDVPAFRRAFEVLEEEGQLEGDDRGRFLLKLTQYLDYTLRSVGQPIAWQDPDAPPPPPPAEQECVRKESAPFFSRTLKNVRELISRPDPPPAAVAPPAAVVSVVIRDGAALTNFFEFCIPSLAGEGGLKALSRVRSVSLLVFAPPSDLPDIKRRLALRNLGCAMVFHPLPDDLAVLADGVPGPQGEWLSGSLQCLHLMEAKRLGADFYSLNPNAAYSDAFFDGILRLGDRGEPAVLLAGPQVKSDEMRRELAQFRQDDDVLTISSTDLASAGLCALTPASGLTVVQDLGYLSGTTSHLQLMWEGKDCLAIHTTQYEIAFLARAVLERLPPRFFMKPSMEVDKIVAGRLPHFVGEADRVAMLDLSGTKNVVDGLSLDFADFGSLVSRSTRERQGEYFKQPVCLAISRTTCQERSWREDAEIARERGAVLRLLDEKRTSLTPTADQALTVLNVLQQYEASEYGLDNLPGAINEGRRILDIAQTNESDIDDAALKELIRASMNFDYVDNAIVLAKKGAAGTAFIYDFFVEMMRLKAANEARMRRLRATSFRRRGFAVIGSIVWGERFVDKFMNYCLPSLLAPGNIPALARKRRVVHSIVTTEADRERIVAHPTFARLRKQAEVVFTCFPPEFLERREQSGYNFYHFYGLLDHQSVYMATALDADLYLLPIDCVYSSECLGHFSASLEGDADCCSVAAIEVEELKLRAWLDVKAKRRANVLDLPGGELLQAASERPDRYFRSLIMRPDNTEFCAHPRELVWPFADGLAIHSIFMHPLAVSARLLSRPFHAPHENVDFALLPRLLQDDGRLKIMKDASEATIAHFGAPVTRDEYLKGRFSIRNFIEVHRYDYAVHRRFFASQQFFPCRDLPYTLSVDYAAELALIQSALVRYRFRVEPA
jgi:hypothetical protein